MMLGKITPVMLPAEQSDMNLIQSRQNKLARDIDIINQKIRNNVLSSAEGAKRIMFKKSEIDQLEIYKRSRRTPTGRLSPPPQTARPVSKKPAKKYNPAASDKVSSATKPADFSVRQPTYKRSTPQARSAAAREAQRKAEAERRRRAMIEADRASMTSKPNQRPTSRAPAQKKADPSVNKLGYREADYYNRLIQDYKNRRGDGPSAGYNSFLKNKAKEMWAKNMALPNVSNPVKQAPPKQQSAKQTAQRAAQSAQSKAAEAAKKAAKRFRGMRGYDDLGAMPQAALVRRKAEMNREMALMRKRAGAAIRLDQPQVARATTMRSWETYGRPEEVAVIKSFVPMLIGLEKFPELTPEGNAMMIEVIQAGNDEKKMTAAANKLATDLVNKSGYFVKKYNVEVDPLQKKVKVSEMSGLAGGLPKTRNSMQRLLK